MSSFVFILFIFRCFSTTRTSSWKDDSVLVILPLTMVARARARSQESFRGLRFSSAAAVVKQSGCSIQSSSSRKVCDVPKRLNRRTERGPTGRSLQLLKVGGACKPSDWLEGGIQSFWPVMCAPPQVGWC